MIDVVSETVLTVELVKLTIDLSRHLGNDGLTTKCQRWASSSKYSRLVGHACKPFNAWQDFFRNHLSFL